MCMNQLMSPPCSPPSLCAWLQVWVTASKLEEAQGNTEMPDKIVPRGIKSLLAAGVVTDRDWWLKVRGAGQGEK